MKGLPSSHKDLKISFLRKMDSESDLQVRLLSELEEYEKTRLLGAGGFGKVYLVKHTKTRVKCAAKEQKTSKYSREEASIIKRLENHQVYIHVIGFIRIISISKSSLK